jgi:hypothetical protein
VYVHAWTVLKITSYLTVLLQGGITYVAQVLKRNRTLKVLNLSENKLDVQALVAIAEALVILFSKPSDIWS